MRFANYLIKIFMLMSWMPWAFAQPAEIDHAKMLLAYVNSPGYKSYLERVFNLGEPPLLKAKCATPLKLLESNRLMVVEPPKFMLSNGIYVVNSGSWVGIAVMDRCGSRVVRRALLRAQPNANLLHPTFLLPGDFRGDLRLEVDARRIVLSGVVMVSNCSDNTRIQVEDIKFHGPPTSQGWSETWTIEACGRTVDADVKYTTTAGTGTTVSAGNWKFR